MASNCVDQAYLELIARNVIFKLLQDHTLQSGLKSCDCNWLGHESMLVTCDALPGLIEDLVEEGAVSRITSFSWDSTAHTLTLATDSQSWTVNLDSLLTEMGVQLQALRDDTTAQLQTLRDDMEDADILTMVTTSGGELLLTRGDGSTLSVDLDTFVRDTVNTVFNELWPCGPLTLVSHDDSLLGSGTTCDPLRVSPAWFVSQDAFLHTVGYDPVTHTLTLQVGPEGGPFETFTVDLATLIPIVVTGPVLTGDGTLNAPLALDCEAAAACIEPFLNVASDTDALTLVTTTTAPTSESPELATTVIGGRTALMGAPDGWMNIAGKRVPYWN